MDAILPFRPLEKEDFRHIAAHFLQECLRRAAERGYSVTAEESVVSAAAAAADARGGARSVRQFISRTVEDGLAGAILSGKVKKGEPVLCRMEGDALVFSPVQIPAPVG